MPNEKPTEPQTTTEPQTVTREEFLKVTQQADSIASILRKEREASAQKMTAMEQRLAEIAAKLDAPAKVEEKPAKATDQTAAELKALRAQLDTERGEREREKAARMQQEERTALSQALTAHGISGPYLKMAMATLYDAERRVTRDEGGNIGFKMQRNGFDEVLPLEKALEEWLTTEDGKTCQPTRNVSGAGVVPGKPGNSSSSGQMTKAQAAALLPGLLRG
jgi:hypothetical protein